MDYLENAGKLIKEIIERLREKGLKSLDICLTSKKGDSQKIFVDLEKKEILLKGLRISRVITKRAGYSSFHGLLSDKKKLPSIENQNLDSETRPEAFQVPNSGPISLALRNQPQIVHGKLEAGILGKSSDSSLVLKTKMIAKESPKLVPELGIQTKTSSLPGKKEQFDIPKLSKASRITKTSEVGNVLGLSKAPVLTKTPGLAKVPGITKAPEPTKVQGVAKAPGVTKALEVTKSQGATEALGVTKVLGVNKAPGLGNTPGLIKTSCSEKAFAITKVSGVASTKGLSKVSGSNGTPGLTETPGTPKKIPSKITGTSKNNSLNLKMGKIDITGKGEPISKLKENQNGLGIFKEKRTEPSESEGKHYLISSKQALAKKDISSLKPVSCQPKPKMVSSALEMKKGEPEKKMQAERLNGISNKSVITSFAGKDALKEGFAKSLFASKSPPIKKSVFSEEGTGKPSKGEEPESKSKSISGFKESGKTNAVVKEPAGSTGITAPKATLKKQIILKPLVPTVKPKSSDFTTKRNNEPVKIYDVEKYWNNGLYDLYKRMRGERFWRVGEGQKKCLKRELRRWWTYGEAEKRRMKIYIRLRAVSGAAYRGGRHSILGRGGGILKRFGFSALGRFSFGEANVALGLEGEQAYLKQKLTPQYCGRSHLEHFLDDPNTYTYGIHRHHELLSIARNTISEDVQLYRLNKLTKYALTTNLNHLEQFVEEVMGEMIIKGDLKEEFIVKGPECNIMRLRYLINADLKEKLLPFRCENNKGDEVNRLWDKLISKFDEKERNKSAKSPSNAGYYWNRTSEFIYNEEVDLFKKVYYSDLDCSECNYSTIEESLIGEFSKSIRVPYNSEEFRFPFLFSTEVGSRRKRGTTGRRDNFISHVGKLSPWNKLALRQRRQARNRGLLWD
ncbi:DUF4183 domain-containing protein [Cryptosporidium felis]|nr:DUF4183 domain-containing protein [Cryptosporidium felis]